VARIEVVTFDLDNTLWDVDAVIRNAERTTRAWFDSHVPELHATLKSEDWLAIRKRIVEEQPAQTHNLSYLREETFARAIVAVGRADAEARRLAAEAFQLFLAERHKVSYFDDALDILERLAMRHRLGALTNGNADIVRLGLDRFFRFAFCAADVGAAKPAPQMFNAALAYTRIRAQQMIHIGDNPIDDIQGAHDVGIATIWVQLTNALSGDATPATRVVNRLKDIPDAIAQIEG
jgi:FMN hydrolase / 5-amino-6-(5-phospho-D-ribitylamino)uracil phosphatase